MSIVQISSMHSHVQSNFFSLFAFWFHMQLRLLYRSFCQIVSIEIPTCLANPKKGGSLHDKCLASLRWMWRRPCRNDDSMSVVTMDGALRRLRCTMPVRGLPLSHAKRFNKIGAACPRCRQSIIWLWPLRSLCVVTVCALGFVHYPSTSLLFFNEWDPKGPCFRIKKDKHSTSYLS